MNNKNKKNIMQLILISAIAFFIAGNIFPMIDFSYSEMLEETGGTKSLPYDDFEIKHYFTAHYWSVRDEKFSELTGGPSEMSKWVILHLFVYTSTEGKTSDEVYDYIETESGAGDAQRTVVVFMGLPLFCLLVVSVFFAVVSLKNSDKKHSRASLYAGVCFIIPLIMSVIMINYSFVAVLGDGTWVHYLNYNLGFYYTIISITLYFVAFFMQRYIEYPKKFFENKDLQQVDSPAD